MALPTGIITLKDVCNEIYGYYASGMSLKQCFIDADKPFDPAYEGNKDRLSNFRGYPYEKWTNFDLYNKPFASATDGCENYDGNPIKTFIHNGNEAYPVVGDLIKDTDGSSWNGANKWWKISGEDYSIQVDSLGYVIVKTACTIILDCCPPTLTSVLDAGINISLAWTLPGAPCDQNITAVGVASSTDGTNFGGDNISSPASPRLYPKPTVDTWYKARSYCSGFAGDIYSNILKWTAEIINCCVPTLDSIQNENATQIRLYYSINGTNCYNITQMQIYKNGVYSRTATLNTSGYILETKPTIAGDTSYQLKSVCGSETSDLSNALIYTRQLDVQNQTYVKQANLTPNTGDFQDVFIIENGSVMLVLTRDWEIQKYNLTTPFDITTLSLQEVQRVQTSSYDARAFWYSPDGKKLYITSDGTGANNILQWNLPTAYSMVNATYVGFISTTAPNPRGIYLSSDGKRMWVVDYKYSDIYEFALSTAFLITTATKIKEKSLDISGDRINTFEWVNSGKTLFIWDSSLDKWYQYTASIAYDISTLVFNYGGVSISLDMRGSFYIPNTINIILIDEATNRLLQYSY